MANRADDVEGFLATLDHPRKAGRLVWAAPDRATLTVVDAADLKASGAAIAALVVRWMKATT